MDLFETTLKVLENRNAAQENLTLTKLDLKQYEDYIRQLKQQLKELEVSSSNNTQILEVNNFSKLEFNSHSVETKKIFGIIYEYVQQIENNLCTIFERERSLYDLCSENDDRLKKAEQSVTNALKLVDIVKKDVGDKALQEAKEIQEEIKATNEEIQDTENALSSIMEISEEKVKELQLIRAEFEILEDKVEAESEHQQSLIDENKTYTKQHIEEMDVSTEMNTKMIEVETSILCVAEKLKEALEEKNEILQKQTASHISLEHLEKEISELEMKIRDAENERDNSIQDITEKINSMKLLIKECESKLEDSKIKTNETSKETDELNAKINSLNDELSILQNNSVADEGATLASNDLEAVFQEHEDLVKTSQKLASLISEDEKKIKQKQQELDLLKNTPNPEIAELKIKIKNFEIETQKKNVLEKEIREIDERNKNLQQQVERHQRTIKNLTSTQQKLEHERAENEKVLKDVTTKYDLIQKEMKLLEAKKKEGAKVFPKPQVKQTGANNIPKQTKKRSIAVDVESDSSVDGERLSYAEFMAKKKKLRESRTKRSTK